MQCLFCAALKGNSFHFIIINFQNGDLFKNSYELILNRVEMQLNASTDGLSCGRSILRQQIVSNYRVDVTLCNRFSILLQFKTLKH